MNTNTTAKPAWIFTFGAGHTLTATGESLANRYVRVVGTYESARDEMIRHFGSVWCDQYPDDGTDRAGINRFGLTELPAAEWPPASTQREIKPAADLTHGDHIWFSGSVAEVRHVEPYTAPSGKPWVLVVLAGAKTLDVPANTETGLATADEIAEQSRAAVRTDMVAGLRALADLIERHALPVPRYTLTVHGQLASQAAIERVAAALDVPMAPSSDGKFVGVDWRYPREVGEYGIAKVEARFSADADAAPDTPPAGA